MTQTIAVAGKGGVGKTTITALLIDLLLTQRKTVLAIDADPSANLHQALGLELINTVGDAREELLGAARSGQFPAGMAKQDFLEVRIQQSLVETDGGLDLLAMGRPEGPGCYCAANNMLRQSIDRLSRGYDYVVIDNEAGLEHISRQTTRDVDFLLIVTDPTVRGITAAGRVNSLIGELRTRVDRIALLVNRVRGTQLGPALQQAIAQAGLDLPIVLVPEDTSVADQDEAGSPLVGLAAGTPVRMAVARIASGLGLIPAVSTPTNTERIG